MDILAVKLTGLWYKNCWTSYPVVIMRAASAVFTILLCMTCAITKARTLTFVGGFDRPPYVIQKTESGFELELIRQVVTRMGHTTRFTFSPFGRSPRLFATTDIDAITTMNQHAVQAGMALSDIYVTYENVVVTKVQDKIQLSSFDDLRGVSLVAFHNARIVLGEAFGRAVTDHPSYLELDNQQTQVSLFLQGRVQALVIDQHVFRYLLTQLGEAPAVTYHGLFAPNDYRVAFRDEQLAAGFNQQLKGFQQTPAYAQLKQQYLSL